MNRIYYEELDIEERLTDAMRLCSLIARASENEKLTIEAQFCFDRLEDLNTDLRNQIYGSKMSKNEPNVVLDEVLDILAPVVAGLIDYGSEGWGNKDSFVKDIRCFLYDKAREAIR